MRAVAAALFDARGGIREADGRRAINTRIGYVDGHLAEVGVRLDKAEVGRESDAFAHLDDDGFILCVDVGSNVERSRYRAANRTDCHVSAGLQDGAVEGDFAAFVAASDSKNEGYR